MKKILMLTILMIVSILSKANFENYVSSEESLWEIEGFYGEDPFGYKKFVVTSSKYKNILCHEELRMLDPRIFERGNDKSHYGIHQHQHIAEIFEKALNV